VETQQLKTQLFAHDKEVRCIAHLLIRSRVFKSEIYRALDYKVYDIAFAAGKDIFGTVGADGSVRMFDLRSLEHSTILYESPVGLFIFGTFFFEM
jgi:hypothetical protein